MSPLILHVDGDAFFVSCEISRRPDLRGKPVVTGSERGIASAMSYEAKRAGIYRAMPIYKARRLIPDLVVLPGDYELYAGFSKRMQEIVERHAGKVEKYSIDECFADVADVSVAECIKRELQSELNITFSIGLATTKTLSKLASNFSKPDGLTVIPTNSKEAYLKETLAKKVWGIGYSTNGYLERYGVRTAFDFVCKPEYWVKARGKKVYETWQELCGERVYQVESGHELQKSISKTGTFSPPTTDVRFLTAHLSRNVENACVKARRRGLVAREVGFFLKTHGSQKRFYYHSDNVKLSRPTNDPSALLSLVLPRLRRLYRRDVRYRATGCTLYNLCGEGEEQLDLFGEHKRHFGSKDVYGVIDQLAHKYGKHIVHLAGSLGIQARDERHGDSSLGIVSMGNVS